VGSAEGERDFWKVAGVGSGAASKDDAGMEGVSSRVRLRLAKPDSALKL